MSVINTMLQDLEQRRVDLDRAGAYRYVRALPVVRQGQYFKIALLACGGLLLVVGAIYFGAEVWRRPVPVLSPIPTAGDSPEPINIAPAAEAQPLRLMPRLSLSVSRELLGPDTVAGEVGASVARSSPAAAPLAQTAERRRDTPALTQALVPVRPTSPATPAAAAIPAEIARVPVPETTAVAQVKALPPASDRVHATAGAPPLAASEIKQISPPQRAEIEYRRGNDLIAQGRSAQALDAYVHALALDVTHDPVRHALVAALLRNKNTAEAERLLVERQALTPRSAAFAMMLARLQAERGDNELALETLRASQSVAGSNPAFYATTAALLARLGQHSQAIAQYQSALRLAPQSGVWWMGLGLSFQAQGSLPEAQEALRRARGSDNLPAELAQFVDQRLRQMQ